jgi:hypothetical protein
MGRGSWRRRLGLACAVGIVVALAAPAGANTFAQGKAKTAPLLFAVQGTGGTYTDDGNGTATLTLTGVNGQATWFTDRPQRQAGNTAIPVALQTIGFAKDPPNAVMTVSLADPDHDALAVKLENPSFDEANAALTFEVTRLRKPPDAGLEAYRSQLDDSVHPSFGQFSLFIDDSNAPVTRTGSPKVPQVSSQDAVPLHVVVRLVKTSPHITIKPIWDGWNQCIVERPFPESVIDKGPNPRLDETAYEVRAWKNFSGACGVEQSRMHWKLDGPGGAVEEIQVVGTFNTITCIDIAGRDRWNISCSGADVHVNRI